MVKTKICHYWHFLVITRAKTGIKNDNARPVRTAGLNFTQFLRIAIYWQQ